MLAVIEVVLEQGTDVVDIDVLFRNENHVRATGDAAGIGDPASIAAHHFNHDHAIVRVGSGMDAVDGFCSNRHGGVVAKGGIGATGVVVDGLGNAHGLNAIFGEEECDGLRVVATES